MIGQISARCRSATSFEPVYDELQTSFEPDSVMEFGLKDTRSSIGAAGECPLQVLCSYEIRDDLFAQASFILVALIVVRKWCWRC